MTDEAVRKVLKTDHDVGAPLDARARELHVRDRRRLARAHAPAGAPPARELQPAVAALRDATPRSPTFVVPPAVAADPEALRARSMRRPARAFEAYRAPARRGRRRRRTRATCCPNAMETKIVVTMNIRELLHFFELRCCKRAQWEIRELALAMLELAEPTAPYIFMDAGASCRRGPCREGKMTCGDPYPKAPEAGRDADVIYVVWLSTLADIPAEVSAGWGKMLGRRQEGWHA